MAYGCRQIGVGQQGLLRSAVVLLQWMRLLGAQVCEQQLWHGVLIFAVGTAGSGTVAGTTGAVDVTAGCECAGGAPGHSGVAGATLPGEEISCVGLLFLHGIGMSRSDVVTGTSICSSTNNLDQVGAMIGLSKDGGGQPKCLGII